MTILETIQASFEAHRNDEQAVPMAAYMRDQFPFLGIPSPQHKALTGVWNARVDAPTARCGTRA